MSCFLKRKTDFYNNHGIKNRKKSNGYDIKGSKRRVKRLIQSLWSDSRINHYENEGNSLKSHRLP